MLALSITMSDRSLTTPLTDDHPKTNFSTPRQSSHPVLQSQTSNGSRAPNTYHQLIWTSSVCIPVFQILHLHAYLTSNSRWRGPATIQANAGTDATRGAGAAQSHQGRPPNTRPVCRPGQSRGLLVVHATAGPGTHRETWSGWRPNGPARGE